MAIRPNDFNVFFPINSDEISVNFSNEEEFFSLGMSFGFVQLRYGCNKRGAPPVLFPSFFKIKFQIMSQGLSNRLPCSFF